MDRQTRFWNPHNYYGNMLAHKKFQLKAQNYELAVDRYLHPLMTGMHNYKNFAINLTLS